jgi:hypothetical protein
MYYDSSKITSMGLIKHSKVGIIKSLMFELCYSMHKLFNKCCQRFYTKATYDLFKNFEYKKIDHLYKISTGVAYIGNYVRTYSHFKIFP